MQRIGTLLVAAGVVLGGCSSAGSGSVGSFPEGGLGGSSGTSAGSACCSQFGQLACTPYANTTQCLQVFNKIQSEAANAGCTSQWNAAVQCLESHPSTCGTSGVVADPACKTVFEAYVSCDPAAECTSSSATPTGGADSACTGNCGGGSISCQITGSMASCTCTAGAQPGTTFTVSATNPCQSTNVYLHCD